MGESSGSLVQRWGLDPEHAGEQRDKDSVGDLVKIVPTDLERLEPLGAHALMSDPRASCGRRLILHACVSRSTDNNRINNCFVFSV
jgi:hypothetical protein